MIFYITELDSNSFLGSVISCIVAKHTMWTVDYIIELFLNGFTGYLIYLHITELASN